MTGEIGGVGEALNHANDLMRQILSNNFFIQTILPFLLVFAVVYAILSMYGPFSNKTNEPQQTTGTTGEHT